MATAIASRHGQVEVTTEQELGGLLHSNRTTLPMLSAAIGIPPAQLVTVAPFAVQVSQEQTLLH